MARVVQQRTSPPYLLILMVFLFLIAATLAVLGYMKADKVQEENAGRSKLQNKVARSNDLEDPRVRQMISLHDNPPGGERPKTVVTRLLGQVETLSECITGEEADPETAMAQSESAWKLVGRRRGLAVEVKEFNNQLELARDLVEQQDQLLAEKQKQLAEKDAEIQSLTADSQTRIDALQEKVAELDRTFDTTHRSYQDDLARARNDWAEQREQFSENIAKKNQLIQELQRKNADLGGQIAKLRRRIEKETQPLADPMTPALKPDGKILRVVAGEDLCYINLGSKDSVAAGMSFTVYPPTGVEKGGEGKASLVITEISETVSECRLRDQQRDDPVVAGDLVANLAFDPTRTYTFVVVGDFDLHGTGTPTPEEAEQVKTLLKQFGGRLADEVDINTDFIILGEKPVPNEEPSASNPQARQVYREQLKAIEHFDRIQGLARGLHIPILNTNRFLAFIGYAPIRPGG